MNTANQRQSISCYDRNKEYYARRCWIYAIVMFLTLPTDVVTFFLGDGLGWIHIPLTLVGLFALCKWLICLLSILNPEFGKLGRSVRRYSDKDYMNFFRMSDAEMEFLNKSISALK